ncbi:MAG: hypothetical protein LBU65_00250 [Planctomycetaceae bacterium]|nr:hypothetical protein [Planctomycetaceae bacterium]
MKKFLFASFVCFVLCAASVANAHSPVVIVRPLPPPGPVAFTVRSLVVTLPPYPIAREARLAYRADVAKARADIAAYRYGIPYSYRYKR